MSSELRILLVDDNPQDRRLVLRELHKACPEASVSEALDREQLVGLLNSTAFDLVVTDYHLHWSDGIEVLKAVKAVRPNCPVIMFTGTGNEEVAVAAMKLGLDDYIIKNVQHLVRLRGSIESALKHAATRARADELSDRLEGLLAQLDVGVFSCTTDGDLLEVNDALVRLLGCQSIDEVRRTEFAGFLARHSASSADAHHPDQPPGRHHAEIRVQRSPGEYRTLRVNTNQIDVDGRVFRIDGLVEDVTLHRHAEQRSRAAAVAEAQLAMLSPREREVLDHVVEGHPNKIIARRLDISEKTVEKHRASLMRKTGSQSVAELVRLALLARGARGQ